jgi:hypothetical protein
MRENELETRDHESITLRRYRKVYGKGIEAIIQYLRSRLGFDASIQIRVIPVHPARRVMYSQFLNRETQPQPA